MNFEGFESWLRDYGTAWESKDTRGFTSLFTEDALYYWTPFGEPKRGHAGIAEAFRSAVARQQDIRFSYEILSFVPERGVARWWCLLKRPTTDREVQLDGIMMVIPDADEENLCKEFREWWHSDEVSNQAGDRQENDLE